MSETPITILPRRNRPDREPTTSGLRGAPFPAGRLKHVLIAAAIFLVTVLVHLQTLSFKFLTTWDDPYYVVMNPWIRGLTFENIRFVFTHPYFVAYFPLHLVSYMVDYSIWGLNPFGFRLQSLILVGLNAGLAFLLTRRLFGSIALGAVAALLDAVHPTHVEAVAWISIRKDLLSTFFLFLTAIMYDEATRDRFRGAWYAASVAIFLLGLLSKVTISTLPLFLVVLDFTRRWSGASFSWGRSLATKIPYLLLAGVLVVVNNMAQAKTDLPYRHEPIQFLMVKGHAVWMYLGLLVGLPLERPIYDPPWLGGLHGPVNLLATLIPVALFAYAVMRRRLVLTLGVAWTSILLLPALAFPLITYMADRYLYAPSLGFLWILAAVILWLAERIRAEGRRTAVLVALTALPFTWFTVQTVRYEALWGKPVALWTYAGQRTKDKRTKSNLAQALFNEKRYDEAERLYLTLTKYRGVDVFAGLATVYVAQRRFEDAQQALDTAVSVFKGKPDEKSDLLTFRAAVEWVRGDQEGAIRDWKEAARLDPVNEEARARLRRAGVEPPPGY